MSVLYALECVSSTDSLYELYKSNFQVDKEIFPLFHKNNSRDNSKSSLIRIAFHIFHMYKYVLKTKGELSPRK